MERMTSEVGEAGRYGGGTCGQRGGQHRGWCRLVVGGARGAHDSKRYRQLRGRQQRRPAQQASSAYRSDLPRALHTNRQYVCFPTLVAQDFDAEEQEQIAEEHESGEGRGHASSAQRSHSISGRAAQPHTCSPAAPWAAVHTCARSAECDSHSTYTLLVPMHWPCPCLPAESELLEALGSCITTTLRLFGVSELPAAAGRAGRAGCLAELARWAGWLARQLCSFASCCSRTAHFSAVWAGVCLQNGVLSLIDCPGGHCCPAAGLCTAAGGGADALRQPPAGEGALPR